MLPLVQCTPYVDHGALLPPASHGATHWARQRAIPGPSPARSLSHMPAHRQVEARTFLTFCHPTFTFCLSKAPVRQHLSRSPTRGSCPWSAGSDRLTIERCLTPAPCSLHGYSPRACKPTRAKSSSSWAVRPLTPIAPSTAPLWGCRTTTAPCAATRLGLPISLTLRPWLFSRSA